jgi:parallel beta-helix repeat protein
MRWFEQLESRQLLTTLCGTPGDDVFSAGPGWARLNGVEYPDVDAFDGLGGTDTANLYDSPGDDLFIARPGGAEVGGIRVTNCEVIHGYAKAGGNDTARLYDSPGDDTLVTKTDWAKFYIMPAPGHNTGDYLRAKFFETVEAYASDGTDVARLNDSEGDDIAHLMPGDVTLFGNGSKRAVAFDFVHTYGRYGGHDVAHLYGERYTARDTYCRMFGDGFVNRAKLFEEVTANRERVNAPTHESVVGETVVLDNLTVRRSIEIGSGTTLTGGTLTRPDTLQTTLSEARAGATRLVVADTTGYRVGDELGLFARATSPEWVIVVDLGPDWIEIENPLTQSYIDSVLVNYFPLIRATGSDITIEGLTLDGNHDLSTAEWQVSGGGLIHMEATHSVIRDVTVVDAFSNGIVLNGGQHNLIESTLVLRSRGHGILLDHEINTTIRYCTSNYNGYQVDDIMGDGIIVNGGAGHLIDHNITNFNQRYGLHPAGDLTRGGVWWNNVSEYNRRQGMHLCWNNFDILVTGNSFSHNRSGIAGLGRGGPYGDRFNIITDNVMTDNWRYGIETNGGGDNLITYNDLRDNDMGSILLIGNHTVFGNLT